MRSNSELVENTLRKWKGALRLRDWSLRGEMAPAAWAKSGDIKIDACNRMAVVVVNETVAPEFLDEVVLHELVHLKLSALDRITEDLLNSLYGEDEDDPRRQFAYGQFMDHLETTTQDLTKAMLALSGGQELMSSPHLTQAVAEELEPE